LALLENSNFTGAVTNEVEVDPLNPHYLTSAQYLGKDHIVVGGTDRSIIKIIDKVIKGFHVGCKFKIQVDASLTSRRLTSYSQLIFLSL
jgi:hypothetical protein